MSDSIFHRLLGRTEEALLARTLLGRRLERDVHGAAGEILFAAGTEIDQALLDEARERELLDAVGHAAEPSTSDSEIADLLWWRREHGHAGGRQD